MDGWIPIWDNRNLLLSGFWFTLSLTLVCIVTSTVLGFLVALARRSRSPVATVLIRVYVEIFRGSPVLIQILFVFFGAAYLRIYGLSTFAAAAIALTLYTAANVSEIFRAGFEAVPAGQREAGRSLGLSKSVVLWNVVFPQAMRVALPPLFGQYITLVKNTSLASVIGYADMVRQAQGIIDRFHNPFEVFLVVGALYFVICYPLSLVARRLERSATA